MPSYCYRMVSGGHMLSFQSSVQLNLQGSVQLISIQQDDAAVVVWKHQGMATA